MEQTMCTHTRLVERYHQRLANTTNKDFLPHNVTVLSPYAHLCICRSLHRIGQRRVDHDYRPIGQSLGHPPETRKQTPNLWYLRYIYPASAQSQSRSMVYTQPAPNRNPGLWRTISS
eukprot:1195432-Prorocentrum_minimum.AAC.4